jgi:hypothetical protein
MNLFYVYMIDAKSPPRLIAMALFTGAVTDFTIG